MNSTLYYVHPSAIVETDQIGAGTRVWAFSHVMSGARIGSDCNIGEQCFVESGALIGDSCVIKNGVALWSGVELSNSVFVGPNAVFTNDIRPRAKLYRTPVQTRVLEGASIGANSTLRCGITIGRWAMIGAGAVVTKDVPDLALIIGNPGRVQGYVCKCGEPVEIDKTEAVCSCGFRFSVSPAGTNLAEDLCEVKDKKRGEL